MATGGATYPLWDRRNQRQQDIVGLTSYERLIQRYRVTLRENLQVADLLPHLHQLGVINFLTEEDITHNAPRKVIVDRLLSHIQTCAMWQFHGLMRACILTDQQHIVKMIGLNPRNYIKKDEETHVSSTRPSSLLSEVEKGIAILKSHQPTIVLQQAQERPSHHQEQGVTLTPRLLQAIQCHCKVCKRILMRRNLYDFGDSAAVKVIDLAKIYIALDAQHERADGNLKEIAEKDILKCLPGEDILTLIRLYGPPGAGKTALGRHIVHDWSAEFLEQLKKSLPIGEREDSITMMVYIPAREIQTTVEAALWDHLHCAEEDKEMLLQHINSGNGTVIILDAIDEIRDEAIMENVRKYIKARQTSGSGPCILVTARTDLCPIDSQVFDRFLVVTGFTVQQGFQYIKAYLSGEKCDKVLQYAKTHQEKLYPILTNPLRLHVLCALVSEGELELEEDDDFCIIRLFSLLENCLLKREGKIVTEEQIQNLYRMSMYGLMHGVREFPESLMDEFNIVEACHVFFVKSDKMTAKGRQVTFSFPHEMVYEFFAGRYIETLSFDVTKSLLLSICSEPNLRNLQRIMFEVILQQEANQHELLQTMIRAILILQHVHDESIISQMWRFFRRKTLFDKMVSLQKGIKPPKSIEKRLLNPQVQEQTKKVNRTWDMINKAFDDHPYALREIRWYLGLANGVFGHVAECLQACPPAQRELLARNSTQHLLPSKHIDDGGSHHVHTTGTSRWSEVCYTQSNTTQVEAWCVEDAIEILNQVSIPKNQQKCLILGVNRDYVSSLWGQPPTNAFTVELWNQLSELVKCWSWESIEIELGRSTPLLGLLESAMYCTKTSVRHGRIGLEDLVNLKRSGRLGDWLWETNIVVPIAGEPAEKGHFRDLRDEYLRERLVGMDMYFKGNPRFVTEIGEKYAWDDNWERTLPDDYIRDIDKMESAILKLKIS